MDHRPHHILTIRCCVLDLNDSNTFHMIKRVRLYYIFKWVVIGKQVTNIAGFRIIDDDMLSESCKNVIQFRYLY